MSLHFELAIGGDGDAATADTWENGSLSTFSTANQVNLLDNTANNILITGVQLEVGSSATDFEHVPWDYQLSRCQRYFCKTFPYATAPADNAGYGGTIRARTITSSLEPVANWMFPVHMRAAPTVTLYNGGAGTAGEWYDGSTSSAAARVPLKSEVLCNIDNSGSALSTAAFTIQAAADAEL